ncbi:hypothetical protein ETD86_07225 [Nonomuraea turkmeniaca]|uniref:Limonene hydroxylase n=1 Tax=Nonomuraea turkmeniaca TaxID=103838 RepID=A0A5S4FTR4_9ACTN|nr:hypothetical protein [Nonomuraea turkmeniaca]TMR23774.1 hypothetical protein ETD86_07225 [Nonomuraea turkmeniaca]
MVRKWWKTNPSIYQHLRDGGGEDLPDEAGRPGLAWAPGAQDGVLIYHWGGQADEEEVRRLSAAITTLKPGAVREAIGEARIVALVDALLPEVQSAGLDPDGIYGLGYALATESSEREAVKLGIALLGLFDAAHHHDELMTLGQHDEFTLFALIALCNTEGDATADLWALARQVHGWGRIHLVERLAQAPDPAVREWIVRQGFRNAVMTAYLAGTAAEAGDLADRLAGTPDDELLEAAGEILATLTEEGGPLAGMSSYQEGRRAAELYLGHIDARTRSFSPADRPDTGGLRHFLHVHALRGYAAEHWPELLPQCEQILTRPIWAELAPRTLAAADDDATFGQAVQVCELLGIPTSDALRERLRAEPYGEAHWHALMRQATPQSVDEVLTLAADLLPLARIAAGPGEENGFGPQFRAHRALDMLLQSLDAWPGRGWPLIAAGLASPVVRNRNLAIRALAAWDHATLPPEARAAVATALRAEQDPAVRERLERLHEGRPQP